MIHVEGYIKDSLTHEAMPAVSVMLKGTTIGTVTDNRGHFSLQATSPGNVLRVSFLGYEEVELPLKTSAKNNVTIWLKPTSYELFDIVVKPGKEKYSRKKNPAVELVEKVIDRRTSNDPCQHDYYHYSTYDQKILAKNDFNEEEARKKKRYKQIDFIFNYIDTSRVSGKPILPLYNEELIEKVYYRKSPTAERKVVQGVKRAGLIEIFSEDGVKQFIEEVFREVDIFQDNIPLFLNRFVSPLASFGPLYYKYYLSDTVLVDGEPCVDLAFVPFNSESFGFTGHLYITLDSAYFVKRVKLNVPRHINLNFVDFMRIEQEFMRTDDGTRLMTKNDITVEFKLSAKSKGTYARRICLYRDHSFEPPEDMTVFRENNPVMETENARKRSDEYWQGHRENEKEITQTSVEKMMAQLRAVPAFFWTEKVVGALINGYVQPWETNSPVEFGPVNTFISGNALEGARYRFGGTTTTNLSRRFFVDGYLAYGAGDKKFKGDLLVEYSFNNKQSFRKEYPFHYVRAEYRYDINQIGQHYLYTNADNVFMMLKRRKNNLITYMQKAELSYYHEHYNGLGYGITARHLTEWASRYVPFTQIRPDGVTSFPVDHYRSAQLEVKLRWAPNEKFYQSRNYRYPITLDAPIITLSHTFARKGILGTDHHYNRTEIGVRKRFWMSPFGYVDLYAQAGKVWDKVPYPLLIIPNANLSYSIEPETYALMDPMEFINDRYASWEVTYFMNGALLNRLPLIKRLQLREVFAFRGWYGDLSDKNNPWKPGNEGLYVFPENSYLMEKRPYMEISCGLDNIFKLIRLDYVWRLSYRDHPHTSNSGLRMKMQFSF
ncbi:DUF5686 and carboxypeptidase-like regulatory domain-containing protein [Tannerella sp.]|uniref:DUF5686 and carboxypeptidase-like regulatory domain-containing protein n=1 Tax=Tannerella sp. TaxID=2382127 RepID=UPI0026DB3FB5|nr:DUF5686 and carboxypeptidase-like regulatory domain-containing protein [Tannerella sp.]MDO4702695.1 DUF5686 family protein [Tannerella sp.]